jgi:hypothetical protein
VNNTLKFALYNFKGDPVAYYLVDTVALPAPKPEPTVGHHVVILDRSGSMSGNPIRDAKAAIEKVFTLEEFKNAEQLVTLISYSGAGDFTTHFARTPVAEIMKPGSRYVEDIRSIRATYLTSAAQALKEALRHVARETTAITLHTDGWFNDPSPAAEVREIERLIETIRPMKNVMINTVAFGSYADFPLLSRIANAMSGRAVQTTNLNDLYNALHDTSALLAGRTQPAVTSGVDGADYQIALNVTQRKVNGTTADLTIRGIGAADDVHVYRFRRVVAGAYAKFNAPEVSNTIKYAFARAKLAEGKLNEAKYAVVSTRNQTLLGTYGKALTAEQITAFSAALEARIYDVEQEEHDDFSTEPRIEASRPPLVQVLDVLNANRDGFTVDLPATLRNYKRRGLRKALGRWNGTVFETFPYRLKPDDDPAAVRVSSFDINNANATVNMLITRPAKLYANGSEDPIRTVAGVKVDGLKAHNNYTLVGDGNPNVSSLAIRINDKALFDTLASMNAVAGPRVFSHTNLYTVPIEAMPLVPYNQDYTITADVLLRAFQLRTAASILKASMTSTVSASAVSAARFTPEQEAELKAYGLTKALAFQPPTAVPYADREAALKNGLVDQRVGYKVSIGLPHCMAADELYSANEYLARRFVVRYSGTERKDVKDGYIAKPKLTDILDPGCTFEVKQLTARTKLNGVDDIQYPLMASFLGHEDKDGETFRNVLSMAGMSALDWPLGGATGSNKLTADEWSRVAGRAVRALQDTLDELYDKHIRPLVFYIGSSGLIPDNWEGRVQVLNAEQLTKKYPDAKGPDGATFFVLPAVRGQLYDVVVMVCPESVDFSTEAGLQAATALGESEPVTP